MKMVIVFSFDKKFLQPAAVAISSLLANASKEEIYTIICLYKELKDSDLNWLLKLCTKYGRCKFRFIDMQDHFSDAFTVGHISNVTYYRFMIPELFPEYDKVLYADVDMLFRKGLSEVWQEDMTDYYIGGVKDDWIASTEAAYLKEIGMDDSVYINAGFLLLNTLKIRQDAIYIKWKADTVNTNNRYSDQDIINKFCKGFIKRLPLYCNFCSANFALKQPLCEEQGKEFDKARCFGNLHYAGKKPWWKEPFVCREEWLWWKYYFRLPGGKEKQMLFYTKRLMIKIIRTIRLNKS